MSTERRFTEEEIAAIFEYAAEAQRAATDHPSADRGLTLAELQKIGAEAGISEEFIARAAASIANEASQEPRQTFLGLPVSASYSVDLPGTFTDEDWGRLVADLRQTFRARGGITEAGSLREWRNGNLYAQVEQTTSGAQLRMGTLKGNAKPYILGGTGWFVWWMAIAFMKISEMDAGPNWRALILIFLAIAGLLFAASSAARLPSWSRQRRWQMEAIAERALKSRSTQTEATELPAGSIEGVRSEARIEIPDEPSGDVEATIRRNRTRE